MQFDCAREQWSNSNRRLSLGELRLCGNNHYSRKKKAIFCLLEKLQANGADRSGPSCMELGPPAADQSPTQGA
jgi:hypothetical protein